MDAIDKINYFLAKKGMTGADLERKIGVSNSVYSQWNTKTTKPSKKSLAKVAQALEVDIIQILPDKVEQKEKPTPEGERIPGYNDLNDTNRKIVDGLIVQLLDAQSSQE